MSMVLRETLGDYWPMMEKHYLIVKSENNRTDIVAIYPDRGDSRETRDFVETQARRLNERGEPHGVSYEVRHVRNTLIDERFREFDKG